MISPIQYLSLRPAKWALAASWALAAAHAQPAAAPPPAEGANPVVASGPAGQVTQSEVEIMVNEMVPAAQRESFWTNPQSVERFARNLYTQRALAAEAVQAGADQSSQGAQYLKLMRERALMTLWLTQSGQAAVPDGKALEAYARSEYRAKPERFALPEEVHARHILVPVAKDGSDDAAAKAKAEALLAELRKGGDFAALAKENSSDKASAQRGGDLGFFTRGKMVPEFEQAVFDLKKPGDLAGPVKTQFGYHIIELTERKAASTQKFEDALPALKEEAAAQLDSQARQRLWDAADAAAQVDEAEVKALMTRHYHK
jgi:peptidyl-prolyl cis-trans isomerase C